MDLESISYFDVRYLSFSFELYFGVFLKKYKEF